MMDILKKLFFSKRMLIVLMLGIFLYIGNLVLQEHVFTSGTWNYRMTVRIDTPEGIKTGSVVRMVWARHGIPILTNMNVGFGVQGDAVVIDLGKRGKVFALLKGYVVDGDYIVFENFKRPGYPEGGGGLTKEGIRYYRALKEGKVVLKPYQYPYLVRFKDLDDPQSIEAVIRVNTNANKIMENHFEEMFGAGVKLKDITIEMTTDPVTRSIDQWPDWMRVYQGKGLGDFNDPFIPFYKRKPEQIFTNYEFTRGL